MGLALLVVSVCLPTYVLCATSPHPPRPTNHTNETRITLMTQVWSTVPGRAFGAVSHGSFAADVVSNSFIVFDQPRTSHTSMWQTIDSIQVTDAQMAPARAGEPQSGTTSAHSTFRVSLQFIDSLTDLLSNHTIYVTVYFTL